jgi:hypothetical protein
MMLMGEFPSYCVLATTTVGVCDMADETQAETSSPQAEGPAPPIQKITFNYIKSNFFRVIHAGGVIGAPSPGGDGIHVGVFSERIPIPVQVTQGVKDGVLGEEIDRVARKDIVREVEVDLIMDLAIAETIAQWILKLVEQVKASGKTEAQL